MNLHAINQNLKLKFEKILSQLKTSIHIQIQHGLKKTINTVHALQENAKIKLKSQKAIIGNEYQLLKDKISTIIHAKQIEKDHMNNGKQKKKKKRGSKRKKNKKQKNNSKIVDKKETSQPPINEIQNVYINKPKQLKQPKRETIRQNQPKPATTAKTA